MARASFRSLGEPSQPAMVFLAIRATSCGIPVPTILGRTWQAQPTSTVCETRSTLRGLIELPENRAGFINAQNQSHSAQGPG